jgi:hypothetical protein
MKWNIRNLDYIPSRRPAIVGDSMDDAAFSDDFNLSLKDDNPGCDYEPPKPIQSCDWLKGVIERLQKLGELKANWDGYGAPSLKAEILIAATTFIMQVASKVAVACPSIVPTRTEGVLFLWKNGQRKLEVQFISRDAASYTYLDNETSRSEKGALFIDSDDKRFWALLASNF